MSSELGNLKAALNSYAKSTEQQAAGMDPLTRACDQSSQQILALIGGSATGKDAEVQAAVNEARDQIKNASNALRRAAQVANSYASSL